MSTTMDRPHLLFASLALNALPATVATAALVLLMHSLIVTDMNPPEAEARRRIEYVSEVPEMTDPQPTQRVERPAEVAAEPDRMEPQIAYTTDDVLNVGPGNSLPPITTDGPITTGTNMVVPYLKLQPEYPARAAKRGIEGYVDLAFDITAAGTTDNIRVIEAQPEGAFERAAIRALEKWKYKVPITDGTPQGQVGMMTRMTFELEK